MGSYREVVDKFPFFDFYVNTFLVLLFTIGIELLICSMAAYAFARLHFPGRDVIFIVLLALLMVPGQIFLVPNYDIMAVSYTHLMKCFLFFFGTRAFPQWGQRSLTEEKRLCSGENLVSQILQRTCPPSFLRKATNDLSELANTPKRSPGTP